MAHRLNQLRQIGALPIVFDAAGGMGVCLVTSRGTGRWIIPKGNPVRGVAPHKTAAQEAIEEAGLVGQVERRRFGTFSFDRIRDSDREICLVDVYVLFVERQLPKWAEMKERSVLRCSVPAAQSMVSSPGLASLIGHYFATANVLPNATPAELVRV